jgi:phthalate 4,5-cis-dihydrodiol dehydrogenase
MDGPLRLGVIGLGRGFTLMLPAFMADPRVRLVAAFDPREDARARFAADFGGRSYDRAEALCDDPDVEAVYVASPHGHHRAHVERAAGSGKHVMVEKPMALNLDDSHAMIDAAKRARTVLVVGHSHSFDLPYLRAREIVRSGAYGRVRMLTALQFTDFLYRPRRPEELDTAKGGGVVFSQAAHQVDIARLIVDAKPLSVDARAGIWDPARPTEGAYSARIDFAGGAHATLTYSGYGRFDTDEFADWWGELGQRRDPAAYGAARRALAGAPTQEAESAMKTARAYGKWGKEAFAAPSPRAHNHFGFVLASCEHADLRPGPTGIAIHADAERRFEPLPSPVVPRVEVIDELHAAIREGKPALHSGEGGLATLEICIAILESARTGRPIELRHQI